MSVSNHLDLVNGDTNSIALLVANDGGDGISLREAILAANATAGADEITFVPALSGQTIALSGMELVIAEAVTIDARPLAENVTIHAGELSRIFNITATTGDFTLGGLTLTGGRTTANFVTGGGGAVRSLSSGNFTLDQSTISGNRTTGDFANGGGIFAQGSVTLTESTVSGNSTTSNNGYGGGIWASGNVALNQSVVAENTCSDRGGGIRSGGGVMLTRSIVSGNNGGGGGGIYATGGVTLSDSTVNGNRAVTERGGGIFCQAAVTLIRSTVSGNSSTGNSAVGGGIYASGDVTLTDSSVSRNSTSGPIGGIRAVAVALTRSTVSGNNADSAFGGIFAGTVTLVQSTVSGNRATSGNGGGIHSFGFGPVTLIQSTVTDNHAGSMGGGVFQGNSAYDFPISISNSIVAGNTAGGGGPDLLKDPQSTLTVNYSLIGTGISPNAGGNNVATNDPLLAPLTNNGGPTQTHATMANSLAINAGDPDVAFDPAEFDQRGGPFVRVFGGRADAGAYERQTVAGVNLVVDSAVDEYDGDFSAGQMSLREAIGVANGMVGADTVTFAARLSGATIALGGTELEITEALTIDARPLAANVTVDAQQVSRVFHITATTGDFTFGGLTIRGGKTTADSSDGGGGAIRSLSTGTLTIDQSAITGSLTTGTLALGGGILAQSDVTLTQSTVSGNSTTGVFSRGGGIASYSNVTLTQSTISGNSTAGPSAEGGGINAQGDVTLTQSTISGNSTAGSSSHGGGIRAYGDVTLSQSTISGNSTTGSSVYGAGVFQVGGFGRSATITGSILAGNGFSDFAVQSGNVSFLTANFSLLGAQIIPDDGGNNVAIDDPMLGPLADNGGPTQTRALLEGSPAIDRGDPAIDFDPGEFDQRGSPLVRVYDGDGIDGAQIDIGAFEAQPILPTAFGDYNQDGIANAADFVVWRNTLETDVTPRTGADGDGDGTVDQDDYDVWRQRYGQKVPVLAVGGAAAVRTQTKVMSTLAEPVTPAATVTPAGEPRQVGPTAIAIHVLDHPVNRRNNGSFRALRPTPVASRRDDALATWLVHPHKETPNLTDLTKLSAASKDEFASNGDAWSVDAIDLALELLSVT